MENVIIIQFLCKETTNNLFITEPVTCASFTRDGQCMIVSTTDSVVRLFDKSTGELLGE